AGEMSEQSVAIGIRGLKMNAPWLKVKTYENVAGWVYSVGLYPKDTDTDSKWIRDVDDIRTKSFFGENIYEMAKNYQRQWQAAQTSQDLSVLFSAAEKIQEAMNNVLSDKLEVEDPMTLPDMTWIERSVPGLHTSLVAEGTQFHLFKNYKKMHTKAKTTEGKEDDNFFELQFAVNEVDSIEHFYKSWFLQTWDYGGSSLLGQGKHLAILNRINEQLSASKIFAPYIMAIKSELLKDISEEYVTYWESKEKILDELRNILQKDFVFLTKADRVMLKTRMKMFENPIANKIEVNQRGGG
ncbi:MAG: hypothetical protein AAF573_20265, partial [Bacteroidota bacterium]